MINISNSDKLSILLPNTNKALTKVLADATPKELEVISQGKDLKSIFHTILKQSANNNSLNSELLQLVKNNPTLKNLGSVTLTLKDLLTAIKSDKNLLPLEQTLKIFLTDITNLKSDELKHKFENSGIFLESKLKHSTNNIKEIITHDLKAILLQASDSVTKSASPNQTEILKHMDKLSLQIDNYQLLSYLSNGSCLYLPYSWDILEKGDVEIKKSKDDKFYCDINLQLKKFGEVHLKLTLYEKNQLNVYVYAKNKEFKELVQNNIPSLRSLLTDAQITLREIRVFELKKKVQPTPYQNLGDTLDMGFEVKI